MHSNMERRQFPYISSLFLVLSLHAAMALESVHLLISMATGRGGCLYGLSDYSVIKAEAKDA